jgi:hypothetical protein
MSANKAKTAINLTQESTNGKNKTVCGRTSSTSSSQSASPTKAEAKKVPPIKAPVGLARGPDLKNVKSKIGSLQNVKHKPMGGEKKVESQKLQWNAKPRIGSLENAKHKPLGGEVKVKTQKLEWKATSKVGSLDNVKHSPGGGSVKIFDEKYVPSNSPTPSKSGSMTPTIDGRENGDNSRRLSGAQKPTEKSDTTERPSTTSSINSTKLPSAENSNLNKGTPISSASSMRSAV